MSKKNKKKTNRSMALVCVDCRDEWKDCTCTADRNNAAWIYVTEQEMHHYFKTGLVPDYKAELAHYEGAKKLEPIKLIHPPEYDFNL